MRVGLWQPVGAGLAIGALTVDLEDFALCVGVAQSGSAVLFLSVRPSVKPAVLASAPAPRVIGFP